MNLVFSVEKVIRQIREETKARVIVFNQVEQCEARVVMCRSMDEAPTLICAAQEALCRCLYTLILEEVSQIPSLCFQQP